MFEPQPTRIPHLNLWFRWGMRRTGSLGFHSRINWRTISLIDISFCSEYSLTLSYSAWDILRLNRFIMPTRCYDGIMVTRRITYRLYPTRQQSALLHYWRKMHSALYNACTTEKRSIRSLVTRLITWSNKTVYLHSKKFGLSIKNWVLTHYRLL